MRVLAVVHQADAGLGVFRAPIEERGDEIVEWAPASQDGPPRLEFDAVVVLGGGMHPHQEEAHPWLREEKAWLAELLEREVPTLGVCLGAELLAEAAGAPAHRMAAPEVGWRDIELTADASDDPVLGALPARFTAFKWHSFETPLPSGAVSLAAHGSRVEAFRLGSAWAIQFHAEVTRGIVSGWLERYRDDPDVMVAGLDLSPAIGGIDEFIEGSNALGAELCARFVEYAAEAAGRSGP